jgi:CelD/BcsL family acetyltransferase involved in cellulose biosynthesis
MSPVLLELAGIDLSPSSVTTPPPPLRIERVVDLAAFTRMRDEWDSLLAESRSDSVFLTWEWLHTWWTHLARDRALVILTLRRGRDLLAVAPFASRQNWFGLSIWEFLGTGRVGSDYLDVIVRRGGEETALRLLTQHVVESGAVLDLRQMLPASSGGMRMASALRRSGCSLRTKTTHRCPFIDLRGLSFETYLGGLGSEHRSNFQRRLRKLEAKHTPRFECVATETRRLEVLPILFELHRLRWEGRGGDGLSGEGIESFHTEITSLALDRGWLRLFVLWLGETPAATLYGFRRGPVFSFYQSGFDPRFSKLGVGLVAMGLAIRSAIEEGASEFDMLHGEEPYKFHWARTTRRLARAVSYPDSVRGRVAWNTSAMLEGLRGLKRKLNETRRKDPAPRRIGGPDVASTS